MKILVINGPNINMLGIREPQIYGRTTYQDLCEMIMKKAEELGVTVQIYQSNHEGDIVDKICLCYNNTDGIIINPAAYTHTSIAILDALKGVGIPAIEVHISDPDEREVFRRVSYVRDYCFLSIKGMGLCGYLTAMEEMKRYLTEHR